MNYFDYKECYSPVYSAKAVKAMELVLSPSLLQIYLSLQ